MNAVLSVNLELWILSIIISNNFINASRNIFADRDNEFISNRSRFGKESIGFTHLWLALNTGVLRPFAVGWVALQIFGFVGALKFANGDFAHPLFKAQVMIHIIGLALLVLSFSRAL